MESLAKKLLERLWPNPISILIIIIIFSLGSTVVIPKQSNDSLIPLIVYIIASIVIILISIFALIKAYRLPKARIDSCAILFIVDTETDRQFLEIKRKLIDEFAILMKGFSSSVFEVLYIPHCRVASIVKHTKEQNINLLLKTRCNFLINVRLISDDSTNSEYYEMATDFAVLHPTYKSEISDRFQEELFTVTKNSRNIKYNKQNKIKIIKNASKSFTLICTYFFGLCFYLNNDLNEASKICDELYCLVFSTKLNESVINYLKSNLPRLCFEIYCSKAWRSLDKYNTDYQETYLDEFENYLIKANEYLPNTYEFYLNQASYHFLKNRNIYEARICLKECGKITKNNTWRYSEAFLFAYEGKNLLTTYRKYKQAFDISYNLVDLAKFIEHILDVEPDKDGLHFALGLIYHELGDDKLMRDHFEMCTLNINLHNNGDVLLNIITNIS